MPISVCHVIIAAISLQLGGMLMPTVQSASAAEATFRIGMIGLDTSHAPSFTKTLNETKGPFADFRVVVAYPHGSADIESSASRIPKYTEEMRSLGVEIVDSIAALLDKCDGVLLETNDGRLHLEQLRPCLKAGKPVFIDKPVAASLADAVAIYREAEAAGVPIFSASSLRYSPSTQAVRQGKESLGRVIGCDAYSPCSLEATHPDLFWYGIHGVETLFTVMGAGCERVSRMTTDGADVVVGTWSDGRIGTFRGVRDGKRGYGGTVFGENGIETLGEYGGYRPLVEEIAKFFANGKPPISAEETLQIYAFMEAADESKRQGGAPVAIADVMKAAQ